MKHESDPHDLIELDELAGLLRDREGPAQPLRRQRLGPSRRLSIAVGLLLAVVAAAAFAIFSERGGEGKPSGLVGVSSPVCVAVVEWQGTRYYGGRANQLLALGGTLGKGTTPPCGDTVINGVPTPPGPQGSVTVVSINGVSPRAAIATLGERTMYYIAPGYFPQLPNTPLHDMVYGPRKDVPDERRDDCAGAKQTEVEAKVGEGGSIHNVTLLDSPDLPRENAIFPEARTVIEGGGAEPHVSPGDLIRAQVLVCRHADDPRFLKLVATRLFLDG